MTVSNTTTKNKLSTNGVTVDFPFTFYLTNTNQVFCKLVDPVTEVETDYTNFTVVKAGDDNGGTVTTLDVLNNTDLLIFRDTPLTQETDYVKGGRFPADSHEAALDKLTLQNQEQQEEIDRTIKVSIGADVTPTYEEIDGRITTAQDTADEAIDIANTALEYGEAQAPIALNGGIWASGQTYTVYNEYMIYNGEAYSPLPATALPYTVGAVPDLGFVYQIKLNDHSLLANRNTAGSHDAIYDRSFSNVQEMIDYTGHVIGLRYSTGGTGWEVVSVSVPFTIDDVEPITDVFVYDFGLDSVAFQSAIDKSFNINFGGADKVYVIDDPVGLPDNNIRSDRFITLSGSGAKILTDSAEAIITSKATLLDPDTTDDLFSGSINVTGLAFSGKTPNLKTAQIFNGDRLYNLHISSCSFDDVRYICHSYRQKGTDPSFAQGYFQSVFFNEGNRVHDVIRIFKGYRAFNISMSDNFLEGDIRLAMEIQSDFGTYAIEAVKITGNVYEGGGLLCRLGAVAAGEIGGGNYFEINNRYTALDYNCLIMIDSSVPSVGLEIATNHFLNSHVGLVDYAVVKFENYTYTQQDYDRWWKGCSIHSNFSNAPRIVDRDGPIRDVNRNSINAETTYKPRPFDQSAIDAFTFKVEDSNATGIATGNQALFKFRFDSDPELSGNNRNFHVKVKARISHISTDYPALPAGQYQVGADYFEFDLLFFYRQGFDVPFDTGMNLVGKVVNHVPAVGSAGGGANYVNFFPTSPGVIIVVNGTDYEVYMSGYVNNTDGFDDANAVIVEATVSGECNWRDILSIGDMRALPI